MVEAVPEAHQRAAEEVRAHLVALRGGAPFLSSTDAALLVGWLDQGVPVAAILAAVEGAAESRRARRVRAPLGLTHARRHLKKARLRLQALPEAEPSTHPLARLAEAVRPDQPVLAEALLGLPAADRDELVRLALGLCRERLLAAWDALPSGERAERLAVARDELEALADVLDEAAFEEAVEALARDTLRQHYPLLCAQAIWDHLEAP